MAKRFLISKSIDIIEFDAVNEWGYPRHKHNFFELTFILKGSGQHILNDNIIDYKEGDIFLLTPNDEHEFVVSQPSRFGIIKFTEQFFIEKANYTCSKQWQKNIETVIFYSNTIPDSIISYKEDKDQIFMLYKMIKSEIENKLVFQRNVLIELFGALLIIVSRNIRTHFNGLLNKVVTEQEKIDAILTYIRQNVLESEKVRIKTIAEEFFISPNYISIFVKKHLGISIQQYVLNTRLTIAERLLTQTDLSISEVSVKTGFTDSSHFNKVFKKYKRINPSEFRKKQNGLILE